jgi:hypothetical protein
MFLRPAALAGGVTSRWQQRLQDRTLVAAGPISTARLGGTSELMRSLFS